MQLLPEPWAQGGRGRTRSCPHSTVATVSKMLLPGITVVAAALGSLGALSWIHSWWLTLDEVEKEGSLTPETNIDQDKINLSSESTENIVVLNQVQ